MELMEGVLWFAAILQLLLGVGFLVLIVALINFLVKKADK
jgi:hypothetical protein